jgi:hypothetical protein
MAATKPQNSTPTVTAASSVACPTPMSCHGSSEVPGRGPRQDLLLSASEDGYFRRPGQNIDYAWLKNDGVTTRIRPDRRFSAQGSISVENDGVQERAPRTAAHNKRTFARPCLALTALHVLAQRDVILWSSGKPSCLSAQGSHSRSA